jgi:polyphenol oxidase
VTLRRDPDQLYRSPLLEAEPWLEHAFGTAAAVPPGPFFALKQVHSARVAGAGEWNEALEADGLVAARPGERIAVKSADCVPILFADPVRRAVAAVHAGWRGTLAGVAAAGVEALVRQFGSRPEDLRVALGPSIGPCCFEVGPEVSVLFRYKFPDWDTMAGRVNVDLREANRLILIDKGVPAEQIAANVPCTCCGGSEFFSWRRDRQTGQRMFAVIGIRE